MPPPYDPTHWSAFSSAGFRLQGAVGAAPRKWALGLPKPPNIGPLPAAPQTRQQVRNICQNGSIPVLDGYLYAMAWGGQSDRFKHKSLAWHNRSLIAPKLKQLRAGGLNHTAAYNLFTGSNAVPGLGPSFFTKLIYFFSPLNSSGAVGFYIMDQWTAKSVNLLTQQWVVRLARSKSASPGFSNKCGNYEAFCQEVEQIAGVHPLGLTGDQIEQCLMSGGGRHPLPWRAHVRANWPRCAPSGRYSSTALHRVYPNIPLNHF